MREKRLRSISASRFMKHSIFILFLCTVGPIVLRSEPFERAEVTKTVNLVSLLPKATRAVPGDVIKGDSALQTGSNSRAELEFPDLTITRVGSNALFRFVAGTREMILDSGTMLFSSPKGAGGGKVQAGAITAAVTGSDFLLSNAGRIKVICLSHKVLVYFTGNPKIRIVLRPGEMIDIASRATKMPRVTTINLARLLSTSKLGQAGGLGPFPNESVLSHSQTGLVAANDRRPDGNDAEPDSADLAMQAAQTARSSTVGNNNSPAPGTVLNRVGGGSASSSGASPSSGTLPNGGAVQNSGASSSNSASGTPSNGGTIVDSEAGGNSGAGGNGSRRGNNANIRDIQNRGNSAVRLDRGNRGR
jgi:FecR protein